MQIDILKDDIAESLETQMQKEITASNAKNNDPYEELMDCFHILLAYTLSLAQCTEALRKIVVEHEARIKEQEERIIMTTPKASNNIIQFLDLEYIYELKNQGNTLVQIGKKIGVSPSTISNALKLRKIKQSELEKTKK